MRLPVPPLPRLGRLLPLPLVGGAAAAFLAVLVGMMTSIQPARAVAFSMLAVFAPLALIDLPLGIALWATTLGLGQVYGIGLASSLGGAGLIFAWFGTLSGARTQLRSILGRLSGVAAPIGILLLWLALTTAWSERPALQRDDILGWTLAAVLLAMVVTVLDTPKRIRLVIAAFIIGAVISVLAGLVGGDLTAGGTAVETAQATEGRFASAGNDPNELAAGLIAGLALALGMLPGARPGPQRLLLILAAFILVAGAAGTQSRGGLVALVCCVAAAVVLARGRRLRALGLTLLISTVGAFALATTPGALDRITSFDSGGNGRSDLWTIAWEMFVDHPVQGVGLDQFRVESKEYVREVGNLEAVNLVVEDPHIVHNTYLQLLAETGIIGLALFLLVVLSCMLAAWRAAGAFERAGRRDLQALAQGVLIGQIGILAAAFFLSIGANLKLWLLLGLGPTLLAAARAPGVRPADARATS